MYLFTEAERLGVVNSTQNFTENFCEYKQKADKLRKSIDFCTPCNTMQQVFWPDAAEDPMRRQRMKTERS